MDVPVIVGLILALALSGTFGLFKKERKQKGKSSTTAGQNAEDFLATVKKVSQVSTQNVIDFLFTINIYTLKKKKRLLGIVLANAKRSKLMVNDVLIETKRKRKFVYNKLPETGFNDKISFEVDSGKTRIITSPLNLFIEELNSLENEDEFFKIVVIDSSDKKFKSGKLALKDNNLQVY
jgi:hypothetical protein